MQADKCISRNEHVSENNLLQHPTPRGEAIKFLPKPFKCPRVSTAGRTLQRPIRKRKDRYNEDFKADLSVSDNLKREKHAALGMRHTNEVPILYHGRTNVLNQAFHIPWKDQNSIGVDITRSPPTLGLRESAVFLAKPLHDPQDDLAIVLYDPSLDEKPERGLSLDSARQETCNLETKVNYSLVHKSLTEILGMRKPAQILDTRVPVVLDPRLARVLRPHQVEGVQFMYRCVSGMVEREANGCIMADEMGLGKTLQCISLLWTLLRQSPLAGKPTIYKAIVVCPASLVGNWANEVVKWLGQSAITPFAIYGKGSKENLTRQLRQWAVASGRSITRPVLIVSYETLRLNVDALKDTEIGILFCDEGHRLKNGESNTFTALNKLNVYRRVILTGTPIQNDLTEFFSLISFANPNLLGSRQDFRKQFEVPILRGRDADASEFDRHKGDECTLNLLNTVNKFLIRRTSEILTKYLPVKYEHVVFCNVASFQQKLYNFVVESGNIQALIRGKGSQPLKAIDLLKKLCNHPDLLDLEMDIPGCDVCFPSDYVPKASRGRDRDVRTEFSGKMRVLERMLATIQKETKEKVVLISNYTSTLDLFERLCRARAYGFLRLDGSMNVNKRQKLVDRFNDPEGCEFIFLLSSKAGGCGINLIGANRLVLFDPDWNPAADQQALARVWRDGQKKDCFVYRFITTGSIEEKIFQRQSHKQSLSSCLVDCAENVERHFSLDSLRELFQFNPETRSDTHDTIKCKRCKSDGTQYAKASAMLYGDPSTWNHFANAGLHTIRDLLLRRELGKGDVSAVFQYISH